MHTAHFETVPLSVSVATIRCHCRGGGWVSPEMNKFEQISSGHHQMSIAGAWTEGWVCHPGGGPLCCVQGGSPYHLSYPMIHLMYLLPCGQNDRHL